MLKKIFIFFKKSNEVSETNLETQSGAPNQSPEQVVAIEPDVASSAVETATNLDRPITITVTPKAALVFAGVLGSFMILTMLLGVAAVGGLLYYNTSVLSKKIAGSGVLASQDNNQGPESIVDIQLKPGAPFLGNPDAKVTLVEYADFQCPFCKKLFDTVLPELKKKYIDTGKIKFVYQDFAFLGEESKAAAEAAKCAQEQGKFWQYHDLLYKNQGPENSGKLSALALKKFGQQIGVDVGKFNQCINSHVYKTAVEEETQAGTGYGVNGTPTVFVNGKKLPGAQPFTAYQQAIDVALK